MPKQLASDPDYPRKRICDTLKGRLMTQWQSEGSTWEMYLLPGNSLVLLQIYKGKRGGRGWDIWRPMTDSNNADVELNALSKYVEGRK